MDLMVEKDILIYDFFERIKSFWLQKEHSIEHNKNMNKTVKNA